MPLNYDPEFQKEISNLVGNLTKKYKGEVIASLIVYLVVLIGFCVVVNYFEFSDTLKLSLVIAFSSFLIIAAIKSMTAVLHTAIVALVGTVEWVGRKQLGEYRTPEE